LSKARVAGCAEHCTHRAGIVAHGRPERTARSSWSAPTAQPRHGLGFRRVDLAAVGLEAAETPAFFAGPWAWFWPKREGAARTGFGWIVGTNERERARSVQEGMPSLQRPSAAALRAAPLRGPCSRKPRIQYWPLEPAPDGSTCSKPRSSCAVHLVGYWRRPGSSSFACVQRRNLQATPPRPTERWVREPAEGASKTRRCLT
jgi:hypothetical protein